ncbi:MAG: hypothetical protein HY735_25650 [Verrucomicrobia bacterium]|nr:hypothetical protein [Verrucomicrobiota bacterium]
MPHDLSLAGKVCVITARTLFILAVTGTIGTLSQPQPANRPAGGSPLTSQDADRANRFSIRRQDAVDWLVKPDGTGFFSLGACCVAMGATRKEFDPDNPGYAAWQQYPDSSQWAEATLRRLKSWGFTTIGGWSDFDILKQRPDPEVVFTPVLHIGSTAGAPWWDMWDAKVVGRMEDVAREQILALRDDPRLLGYYSDNEMGWWNATLFKMTLEQAPISGQRRRLIALLRQTYRNRWPELLKDFEPEGADNWEALERTGMLYLRPGGKGIRVMHQFLGLLAERYYSLVREIIRKYDQRALILGDRYQSFYYPDVARASAPYVDAISSNLNANWSDGSFVRFYLDTLHALTGKPVIIGEFYMAAAENRSGNKNNHGIFPVADTQKERAAGFRRTLEALLRTPYVVGADWFQYFDEPMHGRGDGENFNFGLVDIYDRPYEELTAAAASLDLLALKSRRAPPRGDASQGVPPAPLNPLGQKDSRFALQDWDRERGFVKPVSQFALADLYVCWSKDAIYLGLYSQDIVENAFYRSKIIPKADRAEWIVAPGRSGKTIRARIGGGLEPILNDRGIKIANFSGVDLNVRNIAALELPAQRFGKDRFRAGDTIQFSSTLHTHCQAYRVDWKGKFVLQE